METLKVIGEKGVRITPDIMASGGNGNGDGGGGIGTLLLLNLVPRSDAEAKQQTSPATAPTNGEQKLINFKIFKRLKKGAE